MAETDRPHIAALPDIDVSAHPAVPPSDHPDTTPSVLLSAHSSNTVCPPQLASPREQLAWEEFIAGVSPLTRLVYARAIRRFVEHLGTFGHTVASATPGMVREYIDRLVTKPGHRHVRPSGPPPIASLRTRKQHLAAIRHFYDRLVERHASFINPAASVRSPRLCVERGETIPILPEQVHHLLNTIDTATLIGHRDHTLIQTLALTAARVGAVAGLRRCDVVIQGEGESAAGVLILMEKNSKRRQLPIARGLLEHFTEWLRRLGPDSPHAPVFPSLTPVPRTGTSVRAMSAGDILRMVRRRVTAAAPHGTVSVAPGAIGCHSFRAGAATGLLLAGVELDRVQDLLGHADPRTTRLYDARSRLAQAETLQQLAAMFKVINR